MLHGEDLPLRDKLRDGTMLFRPFQTIFVSTSFDHYLQTGLSFLIISLLWRSVSDVLCHLPVA